MRTTIFFLLLSTLATSCSHLKKSGFLGPLGNLYSEPESVTNVWKRFPGDIDNYLYSEGEYKYEVQLDKDLKAIYNNGTCYSTDGKKLGNTSFCEEVSKLVEKLKTVRNEVTELRKEGVTNNTKGQETSSPSELLVECIEEIQWMARDREWNQVSKCRTIFSKYTPSFFKKSEEIRKSPVSKELGLEKFDAFTLISTNISEPKVKNAIAKSSKKHEASVRSKSKKEGEDNFWSTYCWYNTGYENADKIIAAEPNVYRRQKLINEKEGMKKILRKVREDYKKKNGKPLDDANCKKYTN